MNSNSELLSVLENKVCDDQQAEIERLRAENKRLRVRQKFLLDTGRISVDLTGPDGVSATGTLSRRDCLEEEETGNDFVRVELDEAEGGAACSLGSLLDSRLVLKNAGRPNHPDAVKEVAELTDEGCTEVLDGVLLVTFEGAFEGGDADAFFCLHWRVPASQLSDDAPVPEGGKFAEWRDGPPEWLAAHRDAPAYFTCVELCLPHLFRMYESDDEGGDGSG